MDVDGHIEPGEDFFEVVKTKIAASDVVLVLVGQRWADLFAERQGDSEDFVLMEIKAAIDQNKPVIPVLVNGASMPRSDKLPDAIRAIAYCNAVQLRPERFADDCRRLVADLKKSPRRSISEPLLLKAFSIIEKTPDVQSAIIKLRDLLNVDHVVYYFTNPGDPTDLRIHPTYPPSWIDRYVKMGLHRIDPVVRRDFDAHSHSIGMR
jgi:hypothetical protein